MAPRLRIGVDARPLWIEQGGIPRYLASMLEALEEVAPQLTLVLFTPHDRPPAHAPPAGARIVRVGGPTTRVGSLWLGTAVPSRLRRTREVDVFWAPQHIAPVTLPRRVPVVLTYHDLTWQRFPQTLSRTNRLVFASLGRGSLARADRIVAVSRSTRDDLLALEPGLAERTTVVGEGADLAFQPRPAGEVAEILRPLGLEPADRFFLCVGTLEPRKNLGFLARVWGRAARDGIELAPLLVVGAQGWGDDPFGDELRRRGIEGSVRPLGPQTDESLAALYQRAVALVFPTLYEGFGLPPLEAARMGTPTVAHDIPVLGEGAAAAGVLLPVDDPGPWVEALTRLQDDPEHRNALGQRANEISRGSTWENAARELAAIFEEVAP
jgi:alpha-1,3-rhamnosyl/mannosyltransferase